jgi:ABC-type nitrate/sulfonate/bicarbonate transport system substrate-binding protein
MLLAAAGCSDRDSPDPAGDLQPTTCGAVPIPFSIPLYVAREMGYFREQGLDVTLLPYSSGPPSIEDALSGTVDFAEAGEMPIARAALDGKPIEVVGTISKNSRAMQIIARKDRGIRTPADLRGKRIGVTLGTSGEFYLHVCLVNALIRTGEVHIVDLPADSLAPALLEGEVDAASVWSPYTLMLQNELGANGLALENQDLGLCSVAVSLVVSRDFARGHPERIERFLRAVLQASRFIEKHPNKAQILCAPYVGEPRPLLEREWENYSFDLVLDQGLILSLEDQARWLAEKSHPPLTVPDFLDNVYSAGLRAVEPGAVRIAGK